MKRIDIVKNYVNGVVVFSPLASCPVAIFSQDVGPMILQDIGL